MLVTVWYCSEVEEGGGDEEGFCSGGDLGGEGGEPACRLDAGTKGFASALRGLRDSSVFLGSLVGMIQNSEPLWMRPPSTRPPASLVSTT